MRAVFLAVAMLMISCSGAFAQEGISRGVRLTGQERLFLEAHPVIRVANEQDWPPFDYNEFGRPRGLAIDYIKLLAGKIGMEISFVSGYTWAELVSLFREGEIDVLPAFYRNRDRETYALFTDPYHRGKLGIFSVEAETRIRGAHDLAGRRVGIQKAHGSIPLIRRQVPGIFLVENESNDALVKDLATGSLDAIIGNPLLFHYYARLNQITNIRLAGYVEMEKAEEAKTAMHVGVRKDWPLLHRILQKAAKAVSEEEMWRIESRWTALPPQAQAVDRISLTAGERAFLAAHPVIRVSNEQDYPPYDFAIGGKPQGYSIDLVNLLAERIGISIQYVNGYSWKQLTDLFEEGKLDLLHTLSRTAAREKIGRFSEPFRYYKNHYIVRKDRPDIDNIRQLYGKTVAVGKGWGQAEYLAQQHPAVNLLPVDDVGAMLEAVSTGTADAMISEVPVVQYLFVKRGISDLKISGWVMEYDAGKSRTFHFMAQNSAPELVSMLNRALASLTPMDIQTLERKWFGATSKAGPRVDLTSGERRFIEKHPVITLGGGVSFAPFLMENDDGSVGGYDVDIARMISASTGLRIEFALGPWQTVQEKARKREVDGLSTAVYHESREEHLNASTPYIRSTSLVIVKRGNPEGIFTPKDIAHKRVALQEGNLLFEETVKPHLDNTKVTYYATTQELIRAIVSGEADFTVMDETAFYIATKLGLGGFIESAFPVGEPFDLIFYLRNDWPALLSIVNKGLQSITEREKLSARNRWFGSGKAAPLGGDGQIELTAEERRYLEGKGPIRVCAAPDRMPYGRIDDKGRFSGMGADYRSLFEQRIGAGLQLLPARPKEAAGNAIQKRGCDVLLLAEESAERADHLDFTTPFLSFPYVVATTGDKLFIEDIGKELDKVYTVIKGAPVIARLKTLYPSIALLEVETLLAGAEMVRSGEIFGYIDTSAAIGYAIQKELMLDLKIAGKVPLNIDFSVATPSDEPLLGQIFQKAVGSLSEAERKRIFNQWVAVKYEQAVDYSLAWKILSAAALLVAAVMFWNRKLVAARQQTQLAMEELHSAQDQLRKKNEALQRLAVTDRLTGLCNRMRLDAALRDEMSRAIRYEHALSVILMDIDHFKMVNDKLGHQEGDRVLQAVAVILQSNVRDVDIVGRWGGEEFLIICPETGLSGAQVIAEKLRQRMDRWHLKESASATGSFGVAALHRGEAEADFIRRADRALYRAKENGRNRVEAG